MNDLMFRSLAAFLIFATVATAEQADLSIDFESIPIGGAIESSGQNRTTSTLVYRGAEDGSFVFDAFHNASSGQPDSRIFQDEQGNTQKVVHHNGSMITYQPHDCGRVLGVCRYTVTYANGNSQSFQRTTRTDGDGFISEHVLVREDGKLKRFGINLRQRIIPKRGDKPIGCTRFDFM
ncbi:hypothetical protein [Halovulum sp. GXIMD14793]